MRILDLILQHEKKLFNTINLVASENLSSPTMRRVLASDLGHRYCLPPEDKRPKEIWDYPNQEVSRHIEQQTLAYARQIYRGAYADARPLSGNNVAQIIIKALVPRGGPLMSVPDHCGGHFTTAVVCQDEGITKIDLPYDQENGQVDLDKLEALVAKQRPDLVFLDASMQLFPHPLPEMRAIFGPDVVISYDASHTLGLIGGRQFQLPLEEGADLVHGSTHKSLFGPQKGLIVVKEEGPVAEKIHKIITPLFVSNMHPHHVAALGVALEEILHTGEAYAAKVVENAKRMGRYLYSQGLDILFPHRDFTQSHQIICAIGEKSASMACFRALERVGIHVNGIKAPFKGCFGLRIGFGEVTRRGCQPENIEEIGSLIVDVLKDRRPEAHIRQDVAAFSRQFQQLHYLGPGDEPGSLVSDGLVSLGANTLRGA